MNLHTALLSPFCLLYAAPQPANSLLLCTELVQRQSAVRQPGTVLLQLTGLLHVAVDSHHLVAISRSADSQAVLLRQAMFVNETLWRACATIAAVEKE